MNGNWLTIVRIWTSFIRDVVTALDNETVVSVDGAEPNGLIESPPARTDRTIFHAEHGASELSGPLRRSFDATGS